MCRSSSPSNKKSIPQPPEAWRVGVPAYLFNAKSEHAKPRMHRINTRHCRRALSNLLADSQNAHTLTYTHTLYRLNHSTQPKPTETAAKPKPRQRCPHGQLHANCRRRALPHGKRARQLSVWLRLCEALSKAQSLGDCTSSCFSDSSDSSSSIASRSSPRSWE